MELLNFRFVDREREREITNDFLRNKNNVKTIIVRGKKHAGKNFFIDEIIKENQSLSFIVFDFNQLNNKCAYKLIIDELEKYSNGEFFHFVKHNYTDILQITTNGVRNISKITGNSNVSEILGYMLDSSMFFLNSHKQQESSIKLLNKYIKQIDKNENLVIIIKDFSKCDVESLPIIFQTISLTNEDDKLLTKYIISIDETDWDNNKNGICTFFSTNIAFYPLLIDKFDDSELFSEMLFDIFDLTSEDKNSLEHVFNICNGYPGELKCLLSKLYFKSNKIVDAKLGMAKWEKETINSIIANDNPKVTLNDPISRILFFIIIFLDIDITYDMLLEITMYVCEKMHMLLSNNIIQQKLQELLYTYELLTIQQEQYEFVKLNDKLNKEQLYIDFKDESILPLFSRYISEYLLMKHTEILKVSSIEKYYIQLSYHTYISKYNDWENLNFNAGTYFYKNNQISIAKKIFFRLETKSEKLNKENRFLIAACFYDAGVYDKAEDIIKYIKLKECNYEQLILTVKIKNINMKKPEAVTILNFMLECSDYHDFRFEILDIKQRILSNIETERKKAKAIFDYLQMEFDKSPLTVYSDFLISSMEYYRGKKVQQNLEILEKKFQKEDNQLMLSELYVNKGFDLFWQGKIAMARCEFKKSIKSFEILRIHELSYALNNFANCQMIEGDFEGAISSLKRALMFNSSKYTEIVIKTHLMVCYAIKRNSNYKNLYKDLETFIKENEHKKLDISVYLKVLYSLGFVQDCCGNDPVPEISFDENYCEKAINIARSYDQTTLPYLWFKNWKESIENDVKKRISTEQYPVFHNYRFEPWLLTITHD